jgi:hypothetical protein
MRICVHCYTGPRGEEIPSAFHLGGRRLPVVAVLERWTDSSHRYYEVLVDDGRRFVLRFEPGLRNWELAAVFAAGKRPAPKPVTSARPRRFFPSFTKTPTAPKVS